MCSDGLKKVRLYEREILKNNPSARILYPTDELQTIVTKGICNSKSTKRYLPKSADENPAHCFSSVCDWFEKQGCDTIVAGCTDIRRVYYRQSTASVNYIDSLEVLADAIIERSKVI